jgi:hypothetical protein
MGRGHYGRGFRPRSGARQFPVSGTYLRVQRFRSGNVEPSMPHHCAFCRNPLRPAAEWKAADGLFYCNEFCADAADDTAKLIAGQEFKLDEQRSAA